AASEDDRDGRSRRFRRQGRRATSGSDDDRDAARSQIGGKPGKPLMLPLRPTILDRDILAFHVAELAETALECSHEVGESSWESIAEIANHRHRLRLRARRERPRRRAAEKSDELAPLHGVTIAGLE